MIKAELLKKKGSVDPDQCGCQSNLRYKLPCIHLLPEGNQPIPLSCGNKRWHLFPEDCPPQEIKSQVQDQSDDDDCSVIDMTKDDDDDCSVNDMTAETDEIKDSQKPRQNPNKPEFSSTDSDRAKQILAVYAMMDQIYGMLNPKKRQTKR
ncbi:hypothetical protein [Absidia glauca]|uniref:SWIM-type domain-containing protein n=1 Tax=Absidia glauca TaxID=4829 RepID=A0A168L399_ABSGL|nr:hypothetical protein [Absidia glauca]